jgi:hypothetical protein
VLPVTDIRARHASAVLANQVHLATEWGKPDLGYVLLFRPDRAASAALSEIQERVHELEPSLLRQPVEQLHGSIAWLLAVAAEFGEPKDELWARRGDDWLKLIEAVADATAPMRVRYERLVATDAAIVAVAAEPDPAQPDPAQPDPAQPDPAQRFGPPRFGPPANPMAEFRRSVTDALGLSWPITYRELGVVHSSLFRYSRPLTDPPGLLRQLERLPVAVETEVSEVLMVRELVYPTLKYEVLRRLQLGG